MFQPLRFAALRNGSFLGYINATSQRDANRQARALYGRCEVMLDAASRGMGAIGRRADYVDFSRTHGKSPCRVGDFEARRKAEIADWHARQG